MTFSRVPTLDFYTRDGCHLCDEARQLLQAVMEDRARRGFPNPRVRTINLSRHPELEQRYGARIPVLAVHGQEIELVTSARAIGNFLDRVLPQLV